MRGRGRGSGSRLNRSSPCSRSSTLAARSSTTRMATRSELSTPRNAEVPRHDRRDVGTWWPNVRLVAARPSRRSLTHSYVRGRVLNLCRANLAYWLLFIKNKGASAWGLLVTLFFFREQKTRFAFPPSNCLQKSGAGAAGGAATFKKCRSRV